MTNYQIVPSANEAAVAVLASENARLRAEVAALRALIKSMGNGYDDKAIDAALKKDKQ